MSHFGEYLLAVLFIVAAFLKPAEKFIARGLELGDDSRKVKLVYMGILIVLFTLFFFLIASSSDKDVKEDFFFSVSKCNPKCSGAYFGKPATFQFTTIKEDGVPCTTDECPSYGMIRGCSTFPTIGNGNPDYRYKCPEPGVCKCAVGVC